MVTVGGRRVRRPGLLTGALISLTMLGCLGATSAPYYRVTGGPLIKVGDSSRGSWSVATVRVEGGNWFQWAKAELAGERTVRAEGTPQPPPGDAMAESQTAAALVAGQLAAGQQPVGSAGLQVTSVTADAQATGLHPGDVILAAGHAGALEPLRTQTDLQSAAVRLTGPSRLLLVPETSHGSWGRAMFREVPGRSLAGVTAGPAVAASAYPLGGVQGPSAGLILTLARLDALTSGDLTAGRRVGGTGAISLDGAVTDVGEVEEKVAAAVTAHLSVFFVPVYDRDAAVRAAKGRVPIVAVASVSEAVRWLCATGGHASIC